MNLNKQDFDYLDKKQISIEQLEAQLNAFKTGFPFLTINRPATAGDGIVVFIERDVHYFVQRWEDYRQSGKKIVNFIPASGAASRMFKDLYTFFDKDTDRLETEFETAFFGYLEMFAFYGDLNDACVKHSGKSIGQLILENRYKDIVGNLLFEPGLNYGSLPKGLLKFHTYPDEQRTPVQEHLVGTTLFAENEDKSIHVHFTVSPEHRQLFESHIDAFKSIYENRFGLTFNVGFSEQKPSTDTVSVDLGNNLLRENGQLVFRPGGHGALIENLNDLDADVVFIRNIDNVLPDSRKNTEKSYKQALGGFLTTLQYLSYRCYEWLSNETIPEQMLRYIYRFCRTTLSIFPPKEEKLEMDELRTFLMQKLNRPIRVCGMVKNEGEPGGGPYWVENEDKSLSLQILESSQIDVDNPVEKEKMLKATHFNPVEFVCGLKDFRGKKFDLTKYIDRNTGFISHKSKDGKELKALELPGLWNGSMSDWITVFVEIPGEMFNPVKTVNDLLRPEHQ
ncbi:MAG: DUF4301 family protein [Prevotellaceae bacterium]|jgi:hypothetical protein|nr:DUF4301 family protein [Prevotellaceae bacterium]